MSLFNHWPFKAIHRPASGQKASHRINTIIDKDAVYYSSEPPLDDWLNHCQFFGQESASVSLLNQLEELGSVSCVNNQLSLDWASLYQLLADQVNHTEELLSLLKLPDFTDYRPSLNSVNTLEDEAFRITLADWQNAQGQKLPEPPDVTGGVVEWQNQRFLLTEQVWRLVNEVRIFFTLPDAQRTADRNRQSWSKIRRYACEAQAPMADFLQHTVVLSPETLQLQLQKSDTLGIATIQVEPSFEGAPPQWLKTFDNYSKVPERYDIPDGQGLIQVLVTPPVQSVLQEIRDWPNRYVVGDRAQAFIRNPYATLGDSALAIIDERQFEQARETAGIVFERFLIDVNYEDNGKVKGVDLIIESTTTHNPQNSRYPFTDSQELENFIRCYESGIKRGYQCFVWKGYELEILGNAEFQLAELKQILQAWQPEMPVSISYAEVFNLQRYAERIDGVGTEKPYVSAYIARKSNDGGWLPENVEFGLTFTPDNTSSPSALPLSQNARQSIQEAISVAEQQGEAEINVPGIDKPVTVAEAKQLLKTIEETEEQVKKKTFNSEQHKVIKPALIIKPNISNVDYQEIRKQALELPIDRQASLPKAALRESVKLKQHQLQGVGWLQHLWSQAPQYCRGALLADDMGLGKTLQILTFVARCLEDEANLDPILIVAPVSLLENWQEEIEKFFKPDTLPVLMLYGTNLSRKKLTKPEIDRQLLDEGLTKFLAPNWLGTAKVVLTTYETLRDLEFSLAAQHWSIMVCDEAQKIKNPNALVTRSAKKQNVRFKIACTGTPVENTLADLWCLFDFIQPGLLGALNNFGSRYRKPIEANTDEDKNRIDELRALIEPQTLRRTKAQVADLPSKIEVDSCRALPLSEYQRDLYGQAIKIYKENKINGVVNNHLGLIQYFRQVCTNPYPMGYKYNQPDPLAKRQEQSPKLAWLLKALNDIKQKNEKAIVFVEFLDLQRQLQGYIAECFQFAPDIINGSTTAVASAINSRQKRIKAFQEKPGFGVIILSPLAVGFGVNIQAANHVIHYTRTWNPAKEDQATDRAYRIGQTKDVYVYYPVVSAEFLTFDMKLDKLLGDKRKLADDMLNGCGDLSINDFDDLINTDE